jgi:hypothetical protein
MFSLESAYKLALQQDQERPNQESNSSKPDGERALYKNIWAARVPPKVWIFACCLSQEGLATQCNRAYEACYVSDLWNGGGRRASCSSLVPEGLSAETGVTAKLATSDGEVLS